MRPFALSIIAGIFAWAMGLWYPERLLDRETKLGVLEERITGVSGEFMRRSEKLSETFSSFDACMKGPSCNPAGILAKRDVIVQLEWKDVYDHLAVKQDWGGKRDSVYERDKFFSQQGKIGADMLRNSCVPIIEYRRPVFGSEKVSVYRFEGFRCIDSSGAWHLSRAGIIFHL